MHIDIYGPMVITSYGRPKYFLTFIDDLFMKTFFYIMKIKFEIFDKFKFFKVFITLKTKSNWKEYQGD